MKVDNPCPFLLIRMQKDGDNYFCKSCSKTVIDFRGKTEEEIKCVADKDTCGVFSIDQLSGQQRQSFFRQTAFYFLTVLSFLGFNIKPLTAQTIDTTKTPKDTIIVSNTKNIKKNAVTTNQINQKEYQNPPKKNVFRRKKKITVIGCPAF